MSATNRNLDEMVKTAQFRDDFLFRLKTITIDLPPLREHNEDIGELVFYYIGKLCERYDMKPKSLSSEFSRQSGGLFMAGQRSGIGPYP